MELSDIGLKITILYVQGIKRQGKEENLNRKQKVIKKNEIKILEMKNNWIQQPVRQFKKEFMMQNTVQEEASDKHTQNNENTEKSSRGISDIFVDRKKHQLKREWERTS